MPLSPQDKVFYEQKLSLKSYVYLWIFTALLGAIACPSLLYFQASPADLDSKWTNVVIIKTAMVGFVLGSVVSTMMYLTFRLLLEFEFLPSRR